MEGNALFKLFALEYIVNDKDHPGVFGGPFWFKDFIKLVKAAPSEYNVGDHLKVSKYHLFFSFFFRNSPQSGEH
jgi:hypothetical protein